MALIDSEGRLFGRVNVFDAAAALVVLALGALAVVGYGLLRVPTPPRITVVTPSTLTAGPNLRMDIQGENLLPYLRLYVQRTGESTSVMHETTSRFDAYTLINYARAALLVESPVLAEVRLPDGILPGTYDLVLHSESKVLFVRQAAFTVVPPSGPTLAEVTARFVGDADVLALVREKDADVTAGPDGAAEVVSIQRRFEIKGGATNSLSGGDVRAFDTLTVLDCVVRVPVTKTPTGWSYGSQAIKAGARVTFQTDRYIVQGTIERFTIAPR